VGLLVYIMALLAESQTFRSDKGVYKKHARGGSSLADLRPIGGVVSCRRLARIIPSKNKIHALLSKLST
jgi:hypothetical protein